MLRLTAKAHGHLECSGDCSKHFTEITSFNSANILMRNVLLYLHFTDKETGTEGNSGSSFSSLAPNACSFTPPSVPVSGT